MFFLKHLTKQLSTLMALMLLLIAFQPVQALSTHPQEAVTWPIYHEIVLDEARGWIYGSDNAGNKIDVISMTTLQLVKSYTLTNGASPRGIALSPDGEELAVAQNGLGTLLFIDPDKNSGQGEVVATLEPTATYQQPWKVIYGRMGRLYTSDNVMNSTIRVVDTTTHTVITSSVASFYGCLDLVLSTDKNTLYANQALISTPTLYKLDVSTDDPTVLTYTRHTSGYDGGKFILNSTEEYLFTSYGQVWPLDLTRQVGAIGLAGSMASIPNHDNTIAMTAPSGFVSFVDTTNFYTVSTYALAGSIYGPLVSNSSGTKLFVSTTNGIQVIDLANFPPGAPTPLPTGALPYDDLVLDEARGVMYGSNTTGHKVDVISTSTLQVVDEIRFKNGATPRQLDLRSDGGELAIALWGSSQVALIDPDTLQVNEYIVPTELFGVPAALEPRKPFDVKYGRPGRLYVNTGNPSITNYIHIIDIDNHMDIGMLKIAADTKYLTISADGNQLFANSSYHLYKYGIQTDTPPAPTQTPFNNGFAANTYILMHDENRIMTDYGQVWSNPTDLNEIQKLGQFNLYNAKLVELSSLNLVAAMGTPGAVSFVDTDTSTYSIVSTVPISDVSQMGPGVADSTDGNLYLNTEDGIMLMKLDSALPAMVELQGAAHQNAFVNALFHQPVTVRVLNYLGQPLQGITVKFKVLTTSGAGATFVTTSTKDASALTDMTGVAVSPRLVANGIEGAYDLKISVDGVLNYTSYRLGNLANIPLNPGFEASEGLFYWSTNSTNFSTPLCTIAGCGNGGGTVGPHSGAYWMWFGGTTAPEIGTASQYVGLPLDQPHLKLRFYLWIGKAEKWSGHDDVFNVKIGDTTIFTADATQIDSYSTYTPVVVDISGFSGYQQLKFTSTTRDQVVNFNLDDILISNATFNDVMSDNWAQNYIERLFDSGITGGCSTNPMLYCPDTYVSRSQMAVFLLRGEHGSTYNPPEATGTTFGDVPLGYWAGAWIEQLAAEGITGGCGNGNYCPELTVTRDQMAVFLLRAEHGLGYTPPAATGVFADVPTTHWAAPWIEQLAAEGITGGCGGGNYCPSAPVTRAQMAVFLVRTFNLP